MIFFYDSESLRIIGTIEGRMHNEHTLNNVTMSSSDIPAERVRKYVVPYIPVYETIEVPTEEWRVLDQTGKVGKVITGMEKVEQIKELEPDVPFKDQVNDFESGKEHSTDFDVVVDSDGKVIGFKKRVSQ